MNSNKMDFKWILRDLMLDKGMSQADLSRLTEIPTSLISNYLKGNKSPALSNAGLIAEALGICLDELAGRKILEKCEEHISLVKMSTSEELKLTRKEEIVILAYRKSVSMQNAVDILLGIKEEAATEEGCNNQIKRA